MGTIAGLGLTVIGFTGFTEGLGFTGIGLFGTTAGASFTGTDGLTGVGFGIGYGFVLCGTVIGLGTSSSIVCKIIGLET
jgi:hypothetical protein